MSTDYNSLKTKVAKLLKVTTRPMFGYQCYSISGKFFVGFNNKNAHVVIVRLPKQLSESAIKKKGIKPFSHGAKMGWIEMDVRNVSLASSFKLISNGYNYAKELSKK